MNPSANKPELRVTVFSDYICPFCYIGFERLEKLRDRFNLKVNWGLIEIHPDNPESGRPVSELGYSEEQWSKMEQGLTRMADKDGVYISPHTMTTNSRNALLLAERAKELGSDIFYRLHRQLFRSFFADNQNIADRAILIDIAGQCGIDSATANEAWENPAYLGRVRNALKAAIDLEVTGTPTFFIGEGRLVGAVSVEQLRALAEKSVAS